MKQLEALIKSIFIILITCSTVSATTWYVRNASGNVGGTTSQCTGTTDANYPGSGTGVTCAFKNFQDGLNAAQFGDTIIVLKQSVFVTASIPFSIPAKSGGTNTITDLIVVKSSGVGSLPNNRVGIADAANMFKVVSNNTLAAITPAQNSRWWKFQGMEVTDDGTTSVSRLITTNTPQGGSLDPALFGDNFFFDQCYLHASQDGTTDYTDRTALVGFGWNGGAITITRSRISGFVGLQSGSTCACGAFWQNLGGPTTIDNSTLKSTFNPVFLGAGENGSANTVTISAGTLTTATLSNVTNLQIGDKIALEVHVPSSGGYDSWLFGVTANSSTDTLTSINHGFNNGDTAYVQDYFDTAASVGLTHRGAPPFPLYYIINKTVNTFQLSLTSDGAPINLTGDTPIGGIKVGASGHVYASAEITGIVGNNITFSGGLKRYEGEPHPNRIQPYQYVNSSELPLVGGIAKWRGFQVHDFTFTHNTLDLDFEAQLWMHQQNNSNAKGYMEIKNLIGGLIEGNIITGYPTSLAFTNASQNSTSPWVNIKDVIVRSNIFESFTTMALIQLTSGTMADEGSNIQYINNLAYNIHDVEGLIGQNPVIVYSSGGTLTPFIFKHNTVINKPLNNSYTIQLCIDVMPNPLTDTGQGMQFKDNILWYGWNGVLPATGKTFEQSLPHFVETKNGFIDSAEFPRTAEFINGIFGKFPNSLYLVNDTQVKFVDAASKNYSLQSSSPWKNAASDGTDIGVDWAVLQAALAGGGGSPQKCNWHTSTICN